MNTNYNSIQLIGYVKYEPKVNHFQKDGKENSVLDTVLRVPASYKDKEGKRVYEEVPITFWGKDAENVAEHVNKGDKLGIVGHLQSRAVETDLVNENGEVELNENGNPKKKHEYKQSISVDSISFLGKGIEYAQDKPELAIPDEQVEVTTEMTSPQLSM